MTIDVMEQVALEDVRQTELTRSLGQIQCSRMDWPHSEIALHGGPCPNCGAIV